MRTDFRKIDVDELGADICIVGAGAAGIALAHELLGSGLRVILLESGGFEPDARTELLNHATNVGMASVDLAASRRRVLGGATRLWAGQCVPLDREDFEVRPWVRHSGWPIRAEELEPHYRGVERLLHIEGAAYDETAWAPFGLSPPPLDPALLRHRFTVWPRRVDLARLTARSLARARTVQVLVNATAISVRTDADGQRAAGVEVRSLDGKTAFIRSRAVVLCAGTVENARLLLASNEARPQGLGNQHDLVGRFFQEHPNAYAARLHDADHRYLQDHYALLYRRGRRFLPRLTLASALQRDQEVLNCASVLVFEHPQGSGVNAAKDLVRAMREWRSLRELAPAALRVARDLPGLGGLAYRRFALGRSPSTPPERIHLQLFIEQSPNPDSRVTLSHERDRLGLPVPCVDWRLSESEGRTARVMVRTAAEEFARIGLGRLIPDAWLSDERPERAGVLSDAYHHIGTTRMADDARSGVVDRDARVHGMPNVYVCGASTFPTSSWANPTFTAMALSFRLAGHLTRALG